MIYKIKILNKPNNDLSWFRKNDKNSYIKCFDLIRELFENPRVGTGKPERLKYFDNEVYSRRINSTDRLVYTIYELTGEIDITSFKSHYE